MAKKKAATKKKATTKKTAGRTAGRKTSAARRYWLLKSEPEAYSIDDLVRDGRTYWDGVRNYQARNFLRDDMAVGDGVLFYHSNTDPLAIVGTAKIVRTGYPDHTAFDPGDHHYDPKSDPDNPAWYMVDIELVKKFPEALTRESLRDDQTTAGMMVLARGSRLSVQPVTEAEWQAVHRLAGMPVPG